MTLSAIVEGVEYSLDDGTICYFVGDDGLGMAPQHRLSERGPLQHGDSDRGYRLDPRIVRLTLDIIATSRADWESRRADLLQIFRPSRPVILKMDLNRGMFYLDAYYVGGMAMPSSDRLGWNQTVVVDLKANDPTFYDPEGEAVIFQLGGGGTGLTIPMSVPHTVGASTIDQSTPVIYSGDAATFPFIRITGPITDAVITNISTDEKLDFDGTTIAGGDYYDIDLRYGMKTILDSTGADVFSDLTIDSDHATWHIAADDEVSGGINNIRVQGTGATEATKVELTYFDRYIGI